jgi:hypothetical protein
MKKIIKIKQLIDKLLILDNDYFLNEHDTDRFRNAIDESATDEAVILTENLQLNPFPKEIQTADSLRIRPIYETSEQNYMNILKKLIKHINIFNIKIINTNCHDTNINIIKEIYLYFDEIDTYIKQVKKNKKSKKYINNIKKICNYINYNIIINNLLNPFYKHNLDIKSIILYLNNAQSIPIIVTPNVKNKDKNNDNDKNKIIDIFETKIKGHPIPSKTSKHDGYYGHWLERQFNVKHNSNNAPDIMGYELKKYSNKITFGDFSASEYIYSKKKKYLLTNKSGTLQNGDSRINLTCTRNEFLTYFGTLKKNTGKYSWSGICVPTYGTWNTYGQLLKFNKYNDLCVYYDYKHDTRIYKKTFPLYLKNNKIIIAIWKYEKLKKNINNKFNKKGFIIAKMIGNTFQKLLFGKPFNIDFFIENIKNKSIILDSGMKEGNSRNYSHFRSSVNFWNKLIIEEY